MFFPDKISFWTHNFFQKLFPDPKIILSPIFFLENFFLANAGIGRAYDKKISFSEKQSSSKVFPPPKHDLTSRPSTSYDPLKMFRERLSSQRAATPTPSFNDFSSPNSSQKQHQKPGNKPRQSVIMTGNIQEKYSVPVSNSFNILGN